MPRRGRKARREDLRPPGRARPGGLVFIAATSDRKFRAFDGETGEELWTAALPASGFATPATYLGKKSGRQFVVIAAGGGNKYDKVFSGKIVAFALPKGEAEAK
jgi:quinoprotein glucose dehydrogenase